jgi:cellulose synthase/poly-beta-1,6-N-acetylglucosamine synthase-like glycosyltransferase
MIWLKQTEMINIIITSYGEPESTLRCIDSFFNQKIKEKYKITVIDPFPEIERKIKNKYRGKINFFLDPGEGKSYALNLFLEKIHSDDKNEIIIFTDGDVHVSENSVQEILNSFKDEKVGCVTGKPVCLDEKNKLFGFWSHLVFDGIHKVRTKLSQEEDFMECSGYLFAIRNGILRGFPLEVSEDGIIPYLFWKAGYKIKYVPAAEVYILNNYNWKKWKKQKIRNIKGHENYNIVAPEMPRTKSFVNEIKEGTFFALKYPKNIKEGYWTALLFAARLYIYLNAFYDIKFRKKKYADAFRADYY